MKQKIKVKQAEVIEQQKSVFRAARSSPCPICNHADYAWGTVIVPGPGHVLPYLFFHEDVWEAPYENVTIVRRCKACGNIQFFTEDA